MSVFGRIGAVVATLGDYSSNLISNASGVVGETVSDALSGLDAAKADLVFSAASLVPITATSYAPSAADNGQLRVMNNAAMQTVTFNNGSGCKFVQFVQWGAGQLVLAKGANVEFRTTLPTTKAAKQYAVLTAVLIISGATDYWLITGEAAAS